MDQKNSQSSAQNTRVTNAPIRGELDKKSQLARKRFEWLRAIICAIFAVIIFVLILNYVITPISVKGISMQPTLRTGNIMLVYKWPETWARITGTQYIPNRSNVVIIAKNSVSQEQLIKRVIGLPGETISISNNRLTVYNQNNPAGFNPDSASCCRNLLEPIGTFTTTVPDGQVFALGDNRNPGASIDSRSSIGNIGSSQIVGKVVMRIYPLNEIKFF
ncbi:MAG TPA: signal peptidase I [Candidatus Saccharimonadales bacterium]|jgi:signal peptidase I|nr:signal peptidase I [Candidatus Saccharimonadales bacterium]